MSAESVREHYREQGRQQEYKRILNLLTSQCRCHPDSAYCWAAKAIDLIMAES